MKTSTLELVPEVGEVRVACQLPFSWALGVGPPPEELPPPHPIRNVANKSVVVAAMGFIANALKLGL